MSGARRRLDELKAARRPAGQTPPSPRRKPDNTLAAVSGGFEKRCADGRYWRVDRRFDDVCPKHSAAEHELARPLRFASTAGSSLTVDPRETLVVDIETGGFAGFPVFLIGVVPLDVRPLTVWQFLARDHPEEAVILRELARLAAKRRTWVTFNGKSFDEPFLRDRATLHRVRLTPPAVHVDLLHAARRAWRGELPNCRLGTLEEHILGRRRVGDVPSGDVPALFYHFIETGNAAPLRPVLEHNQIDLVSSTELLLRLATTE